MRVYCFLQCSVSLIVWFINTLSKASQRDASGCLPLVAKREWKLWTFFPFCVLLRFISLIGQRRWLQDNDVYGRERNSLISPARYWPIRLTGTLSIRKVNIITENVCNLHVFNKCSLPRKSELCYYEGIVDAKVLNFTYLHYIWLYMCWRQWIYWPELIVKR